MILNTIVAGGTTLPQLETPATAKQITSGYQAIDQDGKIITGTAPIVYFGLFLEKTYDEYGNVTWEATL